MRFFNILILSLLFHLLSYGQVEIPQAPTCYDNIIGEIGALESDRDPKCHATANRLEDFMYGTPLSFDARKYRTELQTTLAKAIWTSATDIAGTGNKITESSINKAADEYVTLIVSDGNKYLKTIDGNHIEIRGVDLRQYGTIAYSLRAILAVQQEALFGTADLGILEPDAVKKLKYVMDMAMLSILRIADSRARAENAFELSKQHIQIGEQKVILNPASAQDENIDVSTISLNHGFQMLRMTIRQKLQSYQKYNELNQKVFLRNIQVYFAKVMWPKEDEASAELVKTFQDATIQYTTEIMHFAEKLARADSVTNISINHVNRTLGAFLPYEVNKFEDVIYFPLLPKEERITIESYDLDAFRDSGLHWKILEYVLDDPSFKGTLEPDPFAAELIVEAIAQFGVLLWRMGGIETTNQGKTHLSPTAILTGMENIKTLINENNSSYGRDLDAQIISSAETEEIDSTISTYFSDVTEASGIDFIHRSSDWLNRKLRSYVLKKDSTELRARLSIPPAFGGSGVAAEDINNDGYDDILLLSGVGNKLYLNNGDKTFKDITEFSGIINIREDSHFSEPRQPIIADFNNDGFQDIFISYVNDYHQMFMGDGTGKFKNVSGLARLGGPGMVGGPCTALDYDKDGLLDLYIGYFGNYVQGELPTLARNNTNGTPNQLFKNVGDFGFKNVTEGSGVDNVGWTQAVGHTDINNDGWQDIIAGNDFGNNAYYINQGDGTFIDKSVEYDTDKASYTMNIGIADINRDETPDFYISNIVVMEKDDKYVLPNNKTTMHFDPNSLSTMRVVEANDLFISSKKDDKILFHNSKSIDRGIGYTGWSWDADFFDYDNDGDDDLYCLNGMNPYSVYGTENQYYRSPQGSSADVLFAESHSEHNVFFKNESARFNIASEESGLDLYHTSRSAAYTDYDNDGDLDVILSNYHGPAYFYENMSEQYGNNWLKIKLIDMDLGNNRDAIGAKVIIDAGPNKGIWREIHSTDGYLSGHPKTMHVGIGKATEVRLKVIWPDGQEHLLYPEMGINTINITRRDGKITIK